MSAQDNAQTKNRVVYNVQDLFFGLSSGELNTPLVTGKWRARRNPQKDTQGSKCLLRLSSAKTRHRRSWKVQL